MAEANPPPTFSLNPFASAIDLTTANGQKMYTKATTGSSAKFNLTNDATNAENFKQLIDEASKQASVYVGALVLRKSPSNGI